MHRAPAHGTARAWGHQSLLTGAVALTSFLLSPCWPPLSFPVVEGLHVPVSSRALETLELGSAQVTEDPLVSTHS